MSHASKADVVIIGGGITGSSIALALALEDAGRIVLLEKKALGAGSTGKSGAILRQHYGHAVTVGMARRSLGFYRDFQGRFGHDIGFRQPGMLFVAPAAGREALTANIALQQELGVDVRLLDNDELRRSFAGARFGEDLIAAWEPEAAYVDPNLTVRAVARAAASHGAEIHEGIGVQEVIVEDDAARGVQLDNGDVLEAPVIVNAGGPWARAILGHRGEALPLTAIRPEQAFFEPRSDVATALPIVADLELDLYWKPEPKGWTRVGKMSFDGDAEVPDPDRYDEGVAGGFVADCRERVARRLPGFGAAVSWGGCGALYTTTPDAHPLIGELPGLRGLFIVSGFSGHGFKMGPAVGDGVAGLIRGETRPPFDPAFFDPLRHDRGEGITARYAYGILG